MGAVMGAGNAIYEQHFYVIAFEEIILFIVNKCKYFKFSNWISDNCRIGLNDINNDFISFCMLHIKYQSPLMF